MEPERDVIGAIVQTLLERRDTSACGMCGNPEPARVGPEGCEACHAYPRCYLCRRWTDIFPSTAIRLPNGPVVDLCDVCREKGS